jgi:hypothetical protein
MRQVELIGGPHDGAVFALEHEVSFVRMPIAEPTGCQTLSLDAFIKPHGSVAIYEKTHPGRYEYKGRKKR